MSHWGRRALAHALGRTSLLRYFHVLLEHAADPTLPSADGTLSAALAVRTGRADVLDLFAQRGFPVVLTGDDVFLAACARGEVAAARGFVAGEPGLVARLQSSEGALVADFAGAGNTEGVRLLLDLGFDLDSRTSQGGANADPALHVAVWRARFETVKLLVSRGAPLEATNGRGGDAAVACGAGAGRAVRLDAACRPGDCGRPRGRGARVDTVDPFPSGSPADALLREHGRAG
jgi:Ankyrin repeats (many copies)